MAGTDQQQIRQHRDAKGLFDASLLCTDLAFTQAQSVLSSLLICSMLYLLYVSA